MSKFQHHWGKPNVLLHKTELQCVKCALLKVRQHPPHGYPWTEYFRGLDKVAGAGEPTPKCEVSSVEGRSK